MPQNTTIYPLSAVRRVALHTQGLATPPNSESAPTADSVYTAVERIGCVQIDTLQLVQRSQYLVLWSRLGTYDPHLLDRVAFGDPPERKNRRLFEYWLKEACLIPLTEYRYRLPLMRRYRENDKRWFGRWLQNPENIETMRRVLERIRAEGALRGAAFERSNQPSDGWWGWKPAKMALECLYDQGTLMIDYRLNFQRVYNLTERVLPEWVDATEPTQEEATRHLLVRGAKALGVCAPMHSADYLRVKRTEAKPHVQALIDESIFVQVKARLADDKTHTLIIHRDNLPLLEQAADGALKAEHTTFLSPFDNLFWANGRDQLFWGFRQVLEAYKPEPMRQWGYFCLPILHRERLVGRFDPKLERKAGLLRLKALYLEPGVAVDDELVQDTASAMRDFMKFHDAKALEIQRSEPKVFGLRLMRAL